MAVKKSKTPAKKSSLAAKKAAPKKVAAKAAKPAAPKAAVKKAPAVKKTEPEQKKGKKAVIKTTETTASVEGFINKVENEQKRKDSFAIIEMMKKATGEEPKIWGSSIIGFGNKVYRSPKTTREVDWFKIGFAPRKANISLYLMVEETREAYLPELGKYKTDGGCIYINKLEDIDTKVLKAMIEKSAKQK